MLVDDHLKKGGYMFSILGSVKLTFISYGLCAIISFGVALIIVSIFAMIKMFQTREATIKVLNEK
jgi:hypothetical protein